MLYLLVTVLTGGVVTSADGHSLLAWRALAVSAMVIGGAAVWFLGLQAFVLRRFCAFCTSLHVIGLTICGLLIWSAAHATPAAPVGTLDVTIAGTVLAVLIVGQTLFLPSQYLLEGVADSAKSPGRLIASAEAPSPESTARESRLVQVLGGRMTLDTANWPVLGKPHASEVVAYFFDYTCPTCRNVHRLLTEALALCGLDLAVLLIPAPVDPTCNPHVRRQSATNAHACRYARLGLMVWRAGPAKFASFDHWAFQDEEAPPIGRARAYAEELLGVTDFDPSIPDSELEALIAKGVAAYRESGAAKMPTLLFPNAVLTGQVPSATRLSAIIREQFVT